MAEVFVVTTGVISIAAFALQSIQQLIGTIDAIKDVPVTLAGVQQDLRALAMNLEDLNARATKEGWNDSGHAEATEQTDNTHAGLAQALECCKADCDSFTKGLEQWLKHSVNGQISVRDKLMLGWIKTGAINAFKTRLLHSKTTLMLSLGSITAQRAWQASGQLDETKALVIRTMAEVEAYQADIERSTTRVQTDIHRLSSPPTASQSSEQSMQDLRKELELLKACRKADDQAADLLASTGVEQTFGDMQIGDQARVRAGVSNVEGAAPRVQQKFGQINAQGTSRSILGVANNVDFSDF